MEIHYFATCVYGWATHATREGAILKLVKSFQRDIAAQIKRHQKFADLGLYVWSCKVNGPQDARYTIEFFQPKGVEISETQEDTVIRATQTECDWIHGKHDVIRMSYA